MVVAARRNATGGTRDALAELCQAYWYPIHKYVCNQGYPAEDAKDLTQEFFARLIEKDYVQQADQERGRFRSFLLGAVRHFLGSQRRRDRAQKRGGGQEALPLEAEAADGSYRFEPRTDETPDKIFERHWALTVLERALAGLREVKHFEHLKQFLVEGEPGGAYSRVAAELGMSEGALKVAVHRLRRRFGTSLRVEIGRTVETPDQIEEELRYLLTVIRT